MSSTPDDCSPPSCDDIERPSFQRALDAVPTGLVVADPSGRIAFVNSAAERIFLYERNQWQGLSIEVLVPTVFRSGHSERMAEFFKAPATRSMGAGRELTALRRDGTEFPVDIGLSVLTTAEGTWVIASVLDRTESVDLARRCREEHERLQAYWEAASEGLLTVAESGTIETVNRATERIFGYDRLELVGQPLEVLIPEAHRRSHADKLEGYLANPEMRSMGKGLGLYGRRKDGALFPAEVGLNVVRVGGRTVVVGFVTDITERKRLEEQAAVLGTLVDLHQQISTSRKEETVSGGFDPLTGLDTSAGFLQAIEQVNSDTEGRYVVTYAIERLEQMNTRFGQKIGDRILVFASQFIANTLQSESDRLFRWHDSGFLALLKRDSNVERVHREIAQVCGKRLEYFVEHARGNSLLMLSLRFKVIALSEGTPAELLSCVERALSVESSK